MKYTILIVVFILVVSLTGELWAQEDENIYNGPYIQNVTKTGAVILWETRKPATGFVEYGITEKYGMKTDSTALVTREFPIPPPEDTIPPIKLASDRLVSGANVLAVGVWNESPTSDLTLIVRLDLDDAIVLNEGSPVKYTVQSSDISGWMNPSFDDSSWRDGVSGVGCQGNDDNTEMEPSPSAYVRYRFNVKNAGAVENIYLFVDYDDGYVAWLNGTEISRSNNVSSPTPSWNTLTSSGHGAVGLSKGAPNEKRWRSKDTPAVVGTAYIHQARLSGLTSGTEYHYRVHSAQDITPDGRFKTAPDDVNAPFRFVALGDGRSHPDIFKSVANAALKDKPDFFIYVGDLVRSGTNYNEWHDQFFTPGADLLRNVAMFPVIGNHERGSSTESWYYRYMVSSNWYSFDYGNAHFVVLDSQRQDSKAQDDWLIADLEAHKSAKWLFVVLHYHVYSSKGRGTSMSIHEKWTPIFERYGVHGVLSGHEHHYERSYRHGIYYIVSGGAGAEIGSGIPLSRSYNPYKQIAYHINQHCTLDVYNDRAVLWATTPDGKVYDAVTIWADRSPDARPPSRVENLRAEPGAWSAVLRWNAVVDEGLIGYNVYRIENKTFRKLTRLPVKEPSYVDKNLMGGVYAYKVVAIDDWDNESVDSDVVEVIPQKPGGITYLSDLDVISSDGKYRLDLDYFGDSIQLGGQVHNRGIGVQGKTTLVYHLAGQFNEFQASIGIDESLGNDKSDVVFKVFVDGKLAYESDIIKRGSNVQQLSVSIKDAKELKLVVDNNGDSTGDDAVWASARFIR